MTTASSRSKCGECGQVIEELTTVAPDAREPCPRCGSVRRIIEDCVTESLTLREKWVMKHKRPGHRRPIFEAITGDDLHRQSGQWNKLDRTIDRLKDRYTEVITDPATGNVIRSCDEPLSRHQGHGTAKHKPKK